MKSVAEKLTLGMTCTSRDMLSIESRTEDITKLVRCLL